MKKAILIVCLFVLGTTTQAQIISSSSKKVTTTKTSKTVGDIWFFKAGLNSMKFTGDSYDDLKRKIGYKFDLGFKKPIPINLDAATPYWGMEFSLGSRGCKEKETDHYETYESSLFAHNLQIAPINLGINVVLIDKLSFDIHFGSYLSADYYGKFKEKYEGYGSKEERDWSIYDDNADGYRYFDVGINFGIGLWYDKFNFEVGWQRGFIDMWEGDDFHANNLAFKIGFML